MCATHTTIARSSLVHLGQAHASEVSKFCVASLSRAHRDETKLVAAFESLPPSSLKWKQTPDGDGWIDAWTDGGREKGCLLHAGLPPSSLHALTSLAPLSVGDTNANDGDDEDALRGNLRTDTRAKSDSLDSPLLSSPFLQSAGCAVLCCAVW